MRYKKKRYLSREFGDPEDRKRIVLCVFLGLAAIVVLALLVLLIVRNKNTANLEISRDNQNAVIDNNGDDPDPSSDNNISDSGENDESELRVIEPNGTPHFLVSHVRDGDTIEVAYGGNQTQAIRLIGVDTPETVNPEKPIECFGPEASAYAKQKLEGREVGIELDSSQGDYDSYNRVLAYVYLDGGNFNLDLIKNGYGYEYTYDSAYKYQKVFQSAEKYAKARALGLWSSCENMSPLVIGVFKE